MALPTWQSKCSRAWPRRWLELCVRKKCVSNGVLLERQNQAIIIIIIINIIIIIIIIISMDRVVTFLD